MKAARTFALGLVLLVVPSCAKRITLNDFLAPVYKICHDDILKLDEDKKAFAQEVETWSAKVKVWKQREYVFMNSLSNDELQGYSEFKDSFTQGDAKHLLARRKFLALLQESADLNKLTTFKWLEREGGELIKQNDTLDAKWQELEKRRKQLVRLSLALEETKRKADEERRYQETLSAIRGIGSSLDSLRFGLDQWRMQQWLWQR